MIQAELSHLKKKFREKDLRGVDLCRLCDSRTNSVKH